MKICITLDDVLRAKTRQIGEIYKKFINNEIDLENLEITTDELWRVLGFNNKAEYNDFLYKDYTFDIFAESPVTEKMLDKNLNLWHIKLSNEYENTELMLANTDEFNASIGFTYFFLSQIATRVREVYFPTNSVDIWDKCDVLITANPKLLNSKPEGKISIKIANSYNKDCDADYSYDFLSEFINDDKIIDKLIEQTNV